MKNFIKHSSLMICCFLLVACSSKIPNNQELTQTLPQEFSNISLISPTQDTQQLQTTPLEQIQLLFNDSTLNKLFEIALSQNLDLQIANTRILQAQAQLKSAWGELFPSVSGNLRAEESHQRTNTDPVQKSRAYSAQVGATLSWELDLFGRLRHTKNARKSLYEKSLQDLENAKITLLADIATLYFTLLETQKNLQLTHENITHYTTALELTQLKVENGLLDSTELFEKQDLLTNEQNTLENLKTSVEESKNALLLLLDSQTLPFDSSLENLPSAQTSFSLYHIPADVILARPDIKASLLSLHAQAYTKANAKASLFPIISISASLNEILDSTTQTAGNLAWQLASSLTAPILNRTQLTQNYFLQDALFQESYLTLQQSIKNAFNEIQNTSFNTKSTSLQLQNSLKNLENAQSYYEFSYNRHSIGLIDTLEHSLNSASLNNSKKSFNSAQSQNLQALTLLYKAFGGNLNLKTNKESYANN